MRLLSALITAAVVAVPLTGGSAQADNPLAPDQTASPLAGTFANGDGVSLELSPRDDGFAGTLTVRGSTYPVTATGSPQRLAGQFSANGTSFPFTASLEDATLTLQSGGATYTLKRVGAPASPPPPAISFPAPGGQPTPAIPPGMAPPAQDQSVGGVGIAFEPNAAGELVVRAILPGSPADKARLQPGGVLRAVDGRRVDGISMEQVRALVIGTIGTSVTLTIETATEVMDVILIRAAVPQAPGAPPQMPGAPMPNPPAMPAPGMPAPGLPAPGGQPMPTLPAPGNPPMPGRVGFLKPGMRVVYYMGSASIPGARTTLVQDDNGNWIDKNTGHRYAEADNPSSAGAGLHALTVVAADDRDIAVDARNYVLMDVAQGLAVTSALTSYVGTPDGMGDFWQPPARLAAMPEQDQDGLRVRRMQYPVGGRTYNAITITNTAGGAGTYIRNVYDLETGLLIAASSSSTGRAQLTPNPDGTASSGGGTTMITSTRLLGVREMNVPWAGQPLPDWVRANATLDYVGTYENRIPGAEGLNVPPWRIQCRFVIGDARRGWAPAKQYVRLDMGMGGPPQDSETARVLGTSLFDSVWIDPQTLARLQPNTVLDEDPITKRRYVYLGVQGNFAVVMEQGPYEQAQYGYDPRTGLLVAIQQQVKQGPATIITNLQLQRQP